MAPSMLSVALFVLLFSLHICYGADPQPEQIHISATGREKNSFKNGEIMNTLTSELCIRFGVDAHPNHLINFRCELII